MLKKKFNNYKKFKFNYLRVDFIWFISNLKRNIYFRYLLIKFSLFC